MKGWNDCCVFILISYVGSSIVKVVSDNSVIDTPKDIQRMIKVCLNEGDVSYHLYQTNADSNKCSDIENDIINYGVVKK